MQTCTILANDLLQRVGIYPSGASCYMFLYLGFPICKIQRMILKFLCKLSNSCRARGRCCTPVALAWMRWYAGPHHGTREMQKNFVVAHCLFSMCWLYGSGHPGIPSPCLTGKEKEMEGLNQLCDLLLPENVELSNTFGFTQILQGCGEFSKYASYVYLFRAYAFVLFLA